MTTQAIPGGRAGRREWIGLAVLALPTLLLALDLSVVYLALPHLSADLGASGIQQLWIVDIYGFVTAGFMIIMGTVSDRLGRRRLLMIGAAAFGSASVLAAYSVSPLMLIAARALMGVAGAMVMPSALALIRNMFRDPQQRAVAFGVSAGCFMGGAALGPVVGGLLLVHFWWGSVFLLAVPVMVVLLAAAPLLPEYRDRSAGRLDLASVALYLPGILLVIYGIQELVANGGQVQAIVAILAGVAIGAAFLWRQRRLTSPVVDLSLFASPAFSSTLLILLLSVASQGGVMLFVTQHLQLVEQFSPLRAGLWLAPPSLVMIIGSLGAAFLARLMRPSRVIATGLVISVAGYLLLTQVGSTGGLPLLVAGAMVVFLGAGLVGALCNNLVVGSVPPQKAASAASLSQTSGDLGIALGVAILGSVGTAVYRSQIGRHLPAGVPAGVARAARQSIAGAVSATKDTGVLDVARAAFTDGLHVMAGVSGAVGVGLAVLALVVLRHIRPIGAAEPGPARPEITSPDPAAANPVTTSQNPR